MNDQRAATEVSQRKAVLALVWVGLPIAAVVAYLLATAGLENIRWRFSVAWPWWVKLAVVVLPVVSAVLFYRRARAELSAKAWVILVICRTVATIALLLCCFRPQVAFERVLVTKSTLLVLADQSKSMSIADSGRTRFDEVRMTLGKLLPTLGKDFRTHVYRFASAPTPVEGGIDAFAQLTPDGEATNVRRAITQALAEHRNERVSGVIVFTDGIDNSGKSLTRGLAGLGARVFPVGVGSKLRENQNFADIAVTRMEGPKYAIVNNACELDVYLAHVGFASNVVDLTVKTASGETLASAQVSLTPGREEQKETLSITPTQTGKLYIEATVPALRGEKVAENNTQHLILSVISPKIKVLYVQGTVRPEYKWLFRVLQRDANVDVLSLVRVAGSRFIQQGKVQDLELAGFPQDKKTLELFDAVILSDLDATFFTKQEFTNVVDVVREGKGFAMLGGDNSFGPGGYRGSTLAEILPVDVGSREMQKVSELFTLELTAEGVAHPIFAGIAGAFNSVQGRVEYPMRQLRGFVEVAGTKPTATVLAVHPQRKLPDGADMPILVVQPFGKGRCVAFTAYSSARWRRRADVYVAFWGQLIRWLAHREIEEAGAQKGVIASSDKSSYEPGDRIRMFAQVRGEEGAPTNYADVAAHVRRPSGETDKLVMVFTPPADGNYEVSFDPTEAGKYEVTVEARLTGEPLGETTVAFQVGKPNLEYEELDLNDEGLRKIASLTGGEYYYLSNVKSLLLDLVAQQEENRITDVYPSSYRAVLPLLFLVFVGCLTAEWILRKKWRLV